MGEVGGFIVGQLVTLREDEGNGTFATDFGGLGGGEFAVDEVFLDFLEGFGFGFAGGEVLIKLLHDEGGAGVVDASERGDDGFSTVGFRLLAQIVVDKANIVERGGFPAPIAHRPIKWQGLIIKFEGF
jgi:hypothetical protein